jgi:hypothetical protein
VVALHQGAEVELDDVATAELARGGRVMRLGGVLTERGDGVERQPVAAGLAHRELQLDGQVALGHPLHELADHLLEPLVGDGLGPADQRELVGVLDPAELLDLRADGRELKAGRALVQVLEELIRHAGRLEPDAGDPQVAAAGTEVVEEARGVHGPLQVGDLVARLLVVAEVGEEPGVVGGQQQLRVRAGEPGQVADVDQAGDEHRLDVECVQALGETASSYRVIHARASSAR